MAQYVVNWILLGCFYAAIGLGFSLIWGIMNIVNLAQGSLVILGAYVAYWSYSILHLNPFLGILTAMVVLFCVGYTIQYLAINRVIRAPILVTFMMTFGLALLISNLLQAFFTGGYKAINTPYSSAGITLLGARIPLLNVAVAAIAVMLTALLSFFLSRTRVGNAILAVGMDRDAARLMGVSLARTYALTFGRRCSRRHARHDAAVQPHLHRPVHALRLCHRSAWGLGHPLGCARRWTALRARGSVWAADSRCRLRARHGYRVRGAGARADFAAQWSAWSAILRMRRKVWRGRHRTTRS